MHEPPSSRVGDRGAALGRREGGPPVKRGDSSGDLDAGAARFTFKNGDVYDGGYRVDVDRRALVKQDRGAYATDDLDVYDGEWCDDGYGGGEFHIRYNDNARYKGHVDADGMSGAGTYVFPDGSSLTSVWSRNRPTSNIVYREPLGHEWTTASISDSHATFTTANQFWNEIQGGPSAGSSSVPVGH